MALRPRKKANFFIAELVSSLKVSKAIVVSRLLSAVPYDVILNLIRGFHALVPIGINVGPTAHTAISVTHLVFNIRVAASKVRWKKTIQSSSTNVDQVYVP